MSVESELNCLGSKPGSTIPSPYGLGQPLCISVFSAVEDIIIVPTSKGRFEN